MRASPRIAFVNRVHQQKNLQVSSRQRRAQRPDTLRQANLRKIPFKISLSQEGIHVQLKIETRLVHEIDGTTRQPRADDLLSQQGPM
jgi:hypothetical protein